MRWGRIPLYFYVAMERYFNTTNQENSNLCIFAANKKLNKAQLEFSSASATRTFDETLTSYYFLSCKKYRPEKGIQRIQSPTSLSFNTK
jgi:hypothetical protein